MGPDLELVMGLLVKFDHAVMKGIFSMLQKTWLKLVVSFVVDYNLEESKFQVLWEGEVDWLEV